MSQLASTLGAYAAYHRDRRNVATHLVGIPLIVLAVVVLLSRPAWPVGDIALTPAMILSVAAALFYLRLDLRFGLVMAGLLALSCWLALPLAALATAVWLGWGVGLFVAGWAIQFVGHAFEGRKPAFVDDLKSLLVGPLFVVAEVAFVMGMRRALQAELAALR
ncbi:MAG: Mpo1-like protein [Pseudomonadota bacterium]